MLKFLICCFFMIFSFVPVFSQHQINFEHISLKEGLSQSSVKCILQDSKGFMWFGTFDGLNKYDGYKIEVFRSTQDTNSIAGNSINTIYEDSQNNLWIGISQTGLSKYNQITATFELFANIEDDKNSLSDNTVLTLCEDEQNSLWVGTKNGLNKLDKTTTKNVRFTTEDGLYNNFIYKTIKDNSGNIWIGTRSGLNYYDAISKKIIKIESTLKLLVNKKIRALNLDANQILWIATNKGLFSLDTENYLLNQKTDIVYYHCNGNNLTSIAEGRNGNLWLGTNNAGISIFNKKNKTFTFLQNNPLLKTSLTVNNILSVYRDKSNIMWIGTQLGGINKYNILAKTFTTYNYNALDPNSLSSNQIRTIYEDSQGTIWLGTKNGGLNKWLRGENKFVSYQYEKNNKLSIKDNYVRSIWQENDKTLWVGTDTAGILLFDPVKEIFYKQYHKEKTNTNSLSNNRIWKLFKDSKEQIWVATFGGGLNKYNKNTDDFKAFKNNPDDPNSISGNKITTIFEDNKGNLWVGTFENGLNLFDAENEQFIRYKKKATEKEFVDRIYAITEDSQGRLWIASEGGLHLYDYENKTFTDYNYLSLNFSNPVLMSLLEDEKNNFWISTNYGLIKYNIEEGGVKIFYVSDGIQSNEFMIGANLVSSRGEMFFGGINGLDVFYPNQILDNTNKPTVVITKFKILNEEPILDSCIAYKKTLYLDYFDNEFSFEYVAIDYGLSERNQYAYMLDGYDDDWVFSENRRFASYTNLKPGKYVFKVKGSNNDGYWNNNETNITIIIKPPFWQKTWFIVLIIIFLSIGVFALLKFRDVARDKKHLETKVKERTTQIRQQNEEIASQLEQIEQQKNSLHKTYTNVRILSEIGQKITSHLSVENIIETTHMNIDSLMDATIFGIGILNKHQKRLEFKGVKENNKTLDNFNVRLSEENKLSIWSFVNQKPVIINDFSKEVTNYVDINSEAIVGGSNANSLIYQPIVSDSNCIGVITVQSFKKNQYNDYKLNILKNLAVYISIALDNASSYSQIELQKKHITDSISYARRIQEAILPPVETLDLLLNNYFVYFKPRDIVSGDFYWAKKVIINKNPLTVVLAADCTGHGVPGAFMSMLGVSLLNEIVSFYQKRIKKVEAFEPHLILNELRNGIISSLHQTGDFSKPQDGMDIALTIIDYDNMVLKFSGANNPLILIRKNEENNSPDEYDFVEIKADRMPIGYFYGKEKTFNSQTIEIRKNDTIYMFSDGYIDQLGGKHERKFLKKRFKKLLLSCQEKDIVEQPEILERVFTKWISYKNYIDETYEQLDDIVIIGVKI